MCTDGVGECVLMKCSWWGGSAVNGYIRGEKGVATALAYIVKGVGYLKTPCVFRHRQVEGIGFTF